MPFFSLLWLSVSVVVTGGEEGDVELSELARDSAVDSKVEEPA